MRAKKKNKINFERQEKLIHKETMRFLNNLENLDNNSASSLISKSYFPELYDNVANHIRYYLDHPHIENDNLRNYLDEEQEKIKNLFIEENNESDNNDSIINPETQQYTQTIFDITTQSHYENIEPQQYNSLKKLKNDKFSTLTTLEVTNNENKYNDDEIIDNIDFTNLSNEPFLTNLIVKKEKDITFLRKLKYYYLKSRRFFK